MTEETVFDFKDYRAYLQMKAGGDGRRSGLKAQMAKVLRCQPTYVSQIFHGRAHLSLEQAEQLNSYFSHSKDESHYFLLLVQHARAGTEALRVYFEKQIQELHERRLVLTKRLGVKDKLSELHQATYYSSWIYAAVHIAVTIPELRTRDALAAHLNLPVIKITETLDTLLAMGLVEKGADGYQTARSQVRLGNDSKNILRHHTNWRLQAAESLDREQAPDLHYSGVISLSKADVLKVKNIFFEAIQNTQNVVRDSKEEELCAVALDLFNLRRGS